MSDTPVLFVAAVEAELGGLPGLALGVGVVVAAAEAGRVIAERRPAAVVMVGTAGAYAGGPPIGAVVCAETIEMASGTATMGLGYVPLAPGPISGDAALRDRFGVDAVTVVTALAITTDPELAARLGKRGTIEHMEAFGVAWACARAGVPFGAVFGITNRVGPDAHAEWLRHRDGAQRSAQDVAARAVGALPRNG